MYSRHCQWVSNTMAKNKNKQILVEIVSPQGSKNLKKQESEIKRTPKKKMTNPPLIPPKPPRSRVSGNPSSERSLENSGLGLEGPYATFAKQMLLPISVDYPKVSPSNYPSQVCARRIHRVVDVSSATPAYANGFTVVMNPDLFAPGFISAQSAVTVPQVAGISCIEGILEDIPKSLVGDVVHGPVLITDTNGEKTHYQLHRIEDAALDERVGINLVPGAHEVTQLIHMKNGAPAKFETWYKVVGGNWVLSGLATAIGLHEDVQTYWVFPANTDAIGFRRTASVVPCEIRLNLTFRNTQIIGTDQQAFAPAFEAFAIGSKVTHARLISMSCLATNTSPDIANGGNINAGRVPRSFNPFGEVASDLAVLPPNRRLQGMASEGAFVTWMPSQFDEFEVDTLANKHLQLKDAEYIIIKVAGWNPPAGTTASFRLQFDWIIEFYTPNQLFEKVITPPNTPEFEALYHLLLSMDAATCNPGHLDQLRSLIGSGLSGLSSGLEFYGKHKELINGIISLASTLL